MLRLFPYSVITYYSVDALIVFIKNVGLYFGAVNTSQMPKLHLCLQTQLQR